MIIKHFKATFIAPGDQERPDDYMLITLCFVLVGPLIYLSANVGWISGGFRGEHGLDFTRWCLYVTDHILSSLLFDLPEIFNLNFSEISSQSLIAKMMTLLIRLSIVLGLIDLITKVYRALFGDAMVTRYCTLQELCASLTDELDPTDLEVEMHGSVEGHSVKMMAGQAVLSAFSDQES
jgi:hypothetical protein